MIDNFAIETGKRYIVRTITHYHVGELVAIDKNWLVLDKASWIPDTGRWSTCLENGTFAEIEPFPDPVFVNRESIVDVTFWRHELPQKAK